MSNFCHLWFVFSQGLDASQKKTTKSFNHMNDAFKRLSVFDCVFTSYLKIEAKCTG